MDKKALAAVFARAIDALVQTPPQKGELLLVRSTSGTSGNAPLHIVYEVTPEGFDRVRGAERLLICGSAMSQRLSNALLVRYGDTKGQRILCLHPGDKPADLAPILKDFAPDMLFGMSSLIVSVAEAIGPSVSESLRTLIVSGEYLTAPVRAIFARYFPGAAFFQMYASMETNQVSKLFCTHLPANAYHPLDTVSVTIDSPDEQGVGDILFGRTLLRDFKMERYKIGDSGCIVQKPCACGETTTLYLSGRSGYDYLKLAGAVLRKEEFDRVANLCKDYIDEYRAEAFTSTEGGRVRGGIVLKSYRARGVLSEPEKRDLAKKFSAELFITPTRTLEQIAGEGLFVPLTVETVAEPFVRKTKDVTLSMRA